MRTGQVHINGGPFNAHAPLGGYKQSGGGRENGIYGFEEFLESKSLQLKPFGVQQIVQGPGVAMSYKSLCQVGAIRDLMT